MRMRAIYRFNADKMYVHTGTYMLKMRTIAFGIYTLMIRKQQAQQSL